MPLRVVEALERELAAERGNAVVTHELLVAERTRFETLLEKYHALKIVGAEPVPAPLAQAARKEPDILREAVLRHTAGKPALRALALAQLARDRADDSLSEGEILRRIEAGVETEGVPA